jgi:hypothetical protein
LHTFLHEYLVEVNRRDKVDPRREQPDGRKEQRDGRDVFG